MTTENDDLIGVIAKSRAIMKSHVGGPICGNHKAESLCCLIEKMDAFVRKLRLEQGETLDSIGYGDGGDVVMQLVRGAVLVKVLTAINPDGKPGYEMVGFYGEETESTFTMEVDDDRAIGWVVQSLAGYQEIPPSEGFMWLQEPPASP